MILLLSAFYLVVVWNNDMGSDDTCNGTISRRIQLRSGSFFESWKASRSARRMSVRNVRKNHDFAD